MVIFLLSVLKFYFYAMIYLQFMLSYIFFSIFIITLYNMASGAEPEILVTIPQGTLRGQKVVGNFGNTYYSFQDIPYAKPPVGELRFQPPQPAEKWSGIRDATKAVNVCPGYDIWTLSFIKNGSEDCLFVHVYTKGVPKPEKKYPVIVYLHGGAYNFGYGNKNYYSPDYFMSHDVIFVSMNYRLGALGFLSLQTLEMPGNNGMKDQQMALKWIQNNIHYFGGNPNKVTLFGESAGASAAHLHALSPSSKGLFQGLICMSAVGNNFWGYQYKPREYAYLLAKRLGCNAKNDKELLDFLNKTSAPELVDKASGILVELKEQRDYEAIVNVTFVPTVEPEHEGAFMTERPLRGKYLADVPMIVGNTDQEIIIEIYSSKLLPHWTEDKEFQEIIPRDFTIERDSKVSIEIARRIREFYFKDGMKLDGYLDALSDAYFTHAVSRAIKQRLNNKIKSPTYLYLFSFDGKLCFIKKLLQRIRGTEVDIKGAGHADELGYLFAHAQPKFTIEPGSPEHKTILRITELFVNFATTGMPTNEKSEVKWPAMKTSDDSYLDIGNELELKKGLFKERMEFWDEIYKLAGEKL